jgi:hypothetical protein
MRHDDQEQRPNTTTFAAYVPFGVGTLREKARAIVFDARERVSLYRSVRGHQGKESNPESRSRDERLEGESFDSPPGAQAG